MNKRLKLFLISKNIYIATTLTKLPRYRITVVHKLINRNWHSISEIKGALPIESNSVTLNYSIRR